MTERKSTAESFLVTATEGSTASTTDPHEHPILFSSDMVRAILDGRKTQTRRVINPQPMRTPGKNYEYEPSDPVEDIDGVWHFKTGSTYYDHNEVRCPFGKVGDELWVREAHAILDCRPDLVLHDQPYPPTGAWPASVYYAASDCEVEYGLPPGFWRESFDADHQIIRPSIHMPRWASRITLEITGVRVERVKDMPWRDALAEGIEPVVCTHPHRHPMGCTDCMETGILENPVDEYAGLWDSLNAKRGYGWDVNPWVWVIEFRKVS